MLKQVQHDNKIFMRYIDLTHAFTNKMPVYPGDSEPELREVTTLERHGYVNYELKTIMHVGTHIDAPAHMIMGGKRLADYAAEIFVGRSVALDARGRTTVGVELLQGLSFSTIDTVIIVTGWSKAYGEKKYYTDYPVLSEDFANALVNANIKMVGIDSPSPDQPPFPVHKLLLKSEILIIENLMNCEELIGQAQFELFALPLKIEADSALARVIARIK